MGFHEFHDLHISTFMGDVLYLLIFVGRFAAGHPESWPPRWRGPHGVGRGAAVSTKKNWWENPWWIKIISMDGNFPISFLIIHGKTDGNHPILMVTPFFTVKKPWGFLRFLPMVSILCEFPSSTQPFFQAQKTYCCTSTGLGCTTAPPASSELYDCTIGRRSKKKCTGKK